MDSQKYSSDKSRAKKRQADVARKLEKAIYEGQLSVCYQPEIDVTSFEIVTLEALCRWHDSDLNEVKPDEFIGIAEAHGLIVPLGEEVLRQVLRDLPSLLKRWPGVRVAVNVSSLELAQKNFAEKTLAKIRLIDPNFCKSLEIEITESIYLLDFEIAQKNLSTLQANSVTVALDDFGTGHSNLLRLFTLPFDKVKLARSFVQELDAPMIQSLLKFIVEISHDFNKTLVIA